MTQPASTCLRRPPRYQTRSFVPENVDFKDQAQIVELFNRLLQREINSADELQQWLLHRSELEACLNEATSVIYIEMTCQTDDADRAAAYRHVVENIMPAVKPLSNDLDIKYDDLRRRFPLDQQRYQVYDRSIATSLKLFRPENVPLQTEESLLSQKYQTIIGAMTVEFDGAERTLPEMQKFLLQPDRPVREAAWRATAARRLKDKDELESIFDEMLDIRVKIAANAGFNNFEQYQFQAYNRFDYTIADCQTYHQAIQKHVVPLWAEILGQRRRTMKLDTLRPWDTSVDPLNRPPLKPFDTPDQLDRKSVV